MPQLCISLRPLQASIPVWFCCCLLCTFYRENLSLKNTQKKSFSASQNDTEMFLLLFKSTLNIAISQPHENSGVGNPEREDGGHCDPLPRSQA
jgi:hypothetical protein